MAEETDTKRLLQIRGSLEEKIKNLETELDDLKEIISQIDKSIVQQGFRQPKITTRNNENSEDHFGTSITSKDGTVLGRMTAENKNIMFIPTSSLNFSDNIPPFQSFFIDRVLENMKSTDQERASNGEIDASDILSYQINVDESKINSIEIKNYGGEHRLREINSSLRWTFDKMYEKIK